MPLKGTVDGSSDAGDLDWSGSYRRIDAVSQAFSHRKRLCGLAAAAEAILGAWELAHVRLCGEDVANDVVSEAHAPASRADETGPFRLFESGP